MQRRDFLRITAVTSALASVPKLLSAKGQKQTLKMQQTWLFDSHIKHVVIDKNLPHALAYAKKMQSRPVTIALIDRDITAVWNQSLRPQWQQGETWVAGITGSASLFLLEQMAKDNKHRVLHREQLNADASAWLIAPRAAQPSLMSSSSGYYYE